MTLAEYQQSAFAFAKYPEKGTGSLLAVSYCGLGLGECGEVQGKIKKVIRDYDSVLTQEMKEAIISEMGDVLWYLSSLASELGISFEKIGEANLNKLADRENRGVIRGSGDNR